MKRGYDRGVTNCAGDCGRRLRSSRMSAETFPGTVKRYSQGMCEKCFRTHGAPNAERNQEQIRPCSNCQHPTRPQGILSAEAPGTLKRIGSLCHRCHRNCEYTPTEDPELDVTAAAEALEAYLRARRARGVPPEGHAHLELAA